MIKSEYRSAVKYFSDLKDFLTISLLTFDFHCLWKNQSRINIFLWSISLKVYLFVLTWGSDLAVFQLRHHKIGPNKNRGD